MKKLRIRETRGHRGGKYKSQDSDPEVNASKVMSSAAKSSDGEYLTPPGYLLRSSPIPNSKISVTLNVPPKGIHSMLMNLLCVQWGALPLYLSPSPAQSLPFLLPCLSHLKSIPPFKTQFKTRLLHWLCWGSLSLCTGSDLPRASPCLRPLHRAHNVPSHAAVTSVCDFFLAQYLAQREPKTNS